MTKTIKNCYLPLLAATCLTGQLSAQTVADYQSEIMNQGPSNYFKLDSSLESAVNPGVVLTAYGPSGGFTTDIFRNPTNCYYYVANSDELSTTESLISGGGIANSNATSKGSITFLFRSLDGLNIGGQRYLFDATTTGGMGTDNHNALSLFFENDTSTNDPNALKLLFGDSTTVILQPSNIVFGTWYYFALTYDEARVPNKAVWYLGVAGQELTTGMTTNEADAVAGEGTGLFVGNRASFNGAYRNPGNGRIDEFAIFAKELSGAEITNQFSKLPQPPPPGATYQQVVASQLPKYFFELNDSLIESVGNTLMLSTNGTGGAFTNDFLGNPDWAYSFSHTNDALYITNDLFNGGGFATPPAIGDGTGVGAISLQFRMLDGTNNGQKYIFASPADEAVTTDDNRLALYIEGPSSSFFPGALKLSVGQHTTGNNSSTPYNQIPVAYATNLVPNAWYYFAMRYDEARNTPEVFYYFGQAGGILTTGAVNIANAGFIGNNGPLVIGNSIADNVIGEDDSFRFPGKGVVDNFAIWHDELSPEEIQAQFDAMVVPAEPPTLNITLVGANVVLSWPTDGTAGFELESTTSLSSPAWSGAGAPTVVGDYNYVTNSLTGDAKYYRLQNP